MTWRNFEDIDPTYSGYAWVQFWKAYGNPKNPEWTHLCRIWNTDKKPSKWWVGWDFDFDESMSRGYNHRVILVEKPVSQVSPSTGSDYLDCVLGVGGFEQYGPIKGDGK